MLIGRAVALEALKTKSVFDENKRFNPTFYENSETRLDCDTIIMAIGQAPQSGFSEVRRPCRHVCLVD